MKLVDTHCHLTHGRLHYQIAAVLQRARRAGVTAFVCAAGTIEESAKSLALARREADVRALAGVHPHNAKGVAGDYLSKLEELAGDAANVAIGEIGLDYHYDFSPRAAQQRVFAEQLDLARRLGKSVVVHTREAFDDTMACLRASGVQGPRVIFHSFTENADCLRQVLDFGAAVSFSGIVTFKNAEDIRQAAGAVPDDRLLIETDSPYLSPEPMRKMQTNEPANLAHVAQGLAALRGTSPEQLAELTTANAARLFGLDQ